MNQVNSRIEQIFSHAAALQQSGRMRNTIYATGKKIYVLNFDHTVLLRFRLRHGESEFKGEIGFEANDYDSREFKEEDGKILFVKHESGWERTKSCRTPQLDLKRVEEIFRGFEHKEVNRIQLHSSILGLLDESLSHVEFSSKDKVLYIAQRNIYSGSVSVLKREAEGFAAEGSDNLTEDWKPVGIRTNDLIALFQFIDRLSLWFCGNQTGYSIITSDDPKMEMKGVLSHCVYDELAEVTGGKSDGRQESKKRDSEPVAD